MKNYKFFVVLLSLVFLNLNVYAFEENGKGTVDLANYSSFEEEKNQIIKDAKVLACKNALQKYASTFTIDKKKNYEKIKSKVNDNYSQYMVCDSVIDENLDVGENKFTILMKANIDENKIDQALVEVSAIANAGADEVSDIVILMFSAKTKSVKQKDDKVTKVDQTKKSVDVEQTEASTEGETQISSETTETNVTTTGGNTVSSSEVITYEVTDIYNESIEAGLVEILNTAGFELIDGGDLDLEEQIETGGEVKIISGKTDKGTQGLVVNDYTEPLYLDIRLKSRGEFCQAIPKTHSGLIYVIEGIVKVGQTNASLKAKSLGVLGDGDKIEIRSDNNSRFLVIAGKRLNETIERAGPFVMNTKEEVLQAFQDYQQGRF